MDKKKVTNHIIVQALKARVYGDGKDCVEEIQNVLWAYQNTPELLTGKHLLFWYMDPRLSYQ